MRLIACVTLTLCTLGGLVGLGGLAGCKSEKQLENEHERRIRNKRVRRFQRARARALAQQRRLAGLADAVAGEPRILVVPAVMDGGVADATTADATTPDTTIPDATVAPTALIGEGPPREPYDGKPDTMRPALAAFQKWDRLPSTQRDALSPVVNASVSFALDLIGRMGRRRENISLAPWSLWSGLVTLASGATGTTRQELRRLLHLSGNDTALRKQWAWLHRQHIRGLGSAGLKLRTGTGLWVRKGLTLRPAAAKRGFGAGNGSVRRVDIKADPEKARLAMNHWLGRQAGKGVNPLVGRGVVHVDVSLLVTSAATLTGALGKLFPRNGTFNGTFYLPGCKMVQVPMMNSKRLDVYFSKSRDVVLFDIPLRGGGLSLTVLMPPRVEQLAEFQAKVTSAKFRWWLGTLQKTTAKVTLPRLEIGTVQDLTAVFKELGAQAAFGKGATFGDLADPGRFPVETVLHRTPLILKESGVAAPRARQRGVSGRSGRLRSWRHRRRRGFFSGRRQFGRGTFFADRPYLMILRHRTTGTILYLARIYNPRPGGRIETNPSCTPSVSRVGRRRRGSKRQRRRWIRNWKHPFVRSATVVGGLDADDVRKVMKKHTAVIHKCVSDGQKAKPPLKGTVRVGFTIRTNGTVGGVHVTFRKRRHARTGACLRLKVRRWKFGKNPAEATVVGFTVGSFR